MLLVAPQPFYSNRGTPMNVRQMCRVLSRAGFEVDLATYPLGEDVSFPGLRIWRAPRVPGVRSVPIGFSPRKLLLDAALALLVLRLGLTRRYDVIHAIEESIFMVLPLAWRAPLIWDLDSRMSRQLRDAGVLRTRRMLRAAEWLERFALRRSTAAVAVCGALTRAARELDAGARVFQVEDAPLEESLRAPDLARVERLRREWKLEGHPVVVYTGNLESYQGMDLVLGAAPHLRKRVPGAVILLVGGEPDDVERLRAAAAARDLEETVLFVGARPPEEMPEWMALADVLVSPRTLGENTPLKVFTYMRSGIPLVATRLPTHTQVLDSSVALLVEPEPESLAEGLATALGDRESSRRRGARARELAEREFSFASFERKLLEAYGAVLGPGSVPSPHGPTHA